MMNIRSNDFDDIVTITEGANRLVGVTTVDILKLWDGKAANRIAEILAEQHRTCD